MSNVTKLSALEMREGLLKGDFSSCDLVKAHLDRIESQNPSLNSFILVCAERAMNEAREADEKLKQHGEKTPVLTGIPVAIKDMLVTEGIETTCGSKILEGFIPPYECTAVAKLREAGAIVVGKTNLDEFAMGSSNENSAYGAVKNPWDEARVPGGSSGGSAVSVCAGQSPISLGTDTGGSIRQPAAMCGVVGLRPTYGRVSRYGAVAYASSLDQIGPFARTVEDVALTLGIISGADPMDSTSVDEEVVDFLGEIQKTRESGIAGMRVGVPKEYFIDGMEPSVEKEVKASIAKLEELGAKIVEISLPHTDFALGTYYILAPAEASSNLARYDGVRYGPRAEAKSIAEMYEQTREEGFGEEVKRRILMGNYVLSAGYYDQYYLKAQQVRTLIANDFKSAFANSCDVIATPVSPTTAFKLGEKTNSPIQMYLADVFTMPPNLAGLPALSLPIALDDKELPIGLQLIGNAFDELTILRAAAALEHSVAFDVQRMAQ